MTMTDAEKQAFEAYERRTVSEGWIPMTPEQRAQIRRQQALGSLRYLEESDLVTEREAERIRKRIERQS
jgi:hypothetical protein